MTFLLASICSGILIGLHHPPQGDRHVPPTADRFVTSRDGLDLPLPEEDDAFFFIVYGDRTGGPAAGIRILEQAVTDTNLLDPDLVMTVGDLINGYNLPPQWMAQMKEFRGVMGELNMPWYPVAGNHDIYWRGPGRPPQEHEDNYETHFGPLWYAFEHKDCWFIVLYSDEPDPETGVRNFSKPASQRMSPEQFQWLQETLTKTTDARHVFVFIHHPRWFGGNYGDDWRRVHTLLADAGNVSAVFAGHVHRMRYDGPHDGIEYFTLATTGGGQSHAVPSGGYLHHFDVVTVRDESIAVATLPVGEVINHRAITAEVQSNLLSILKTRPTFSGAAQLHPAADTDDVITCSWRNPTDHPIDLTLVPESSDPRWFFTPDHVHLTVDARATVDVDIRSRRSGGTIDDHFDLPAVAITAILETESARFPVPEAIVELPIDIELAAPLRPAMESVAHFDGVDDVLQLRSSQIALPDGPMTLEAWARGDAFGARTGLITKTESSEFGIFCSNGIPQFSLHLNNRYVEPVSKDVVMTPGKWHHIAGVYDGTEVRLYLDGQLVAAETASGTRTLNVLPLYIGADVAADGTAMSFFDGAIDEVRLSSTSRYWGESFEPQRRFTTDDETVLLLHMDPVSGPWVFDHSRHQSHPRRRGGVDISSDGATESQ